MMPIDHAAFGILLPSVIKKYRNKTAISVSVASSLFPDIITVFSGGPGTIGYLSHRSITHSFILAPAFSLLTAFLISYCLKIIVKTLFVSFVFSRLSLIVSTS